MPPEPLPWDRRDFFKERKRERSTESIGFVSRWRENPHHGHEFVRSRPPGHAKQGGRHNFSQEPGHEFTPSRSNEKIFGDENCRPSESLADGKFSRNSRENRGSFSQKDWRGHSWENGSSPNGPGRSTSVSDQRSVDDMIPYDSHPHSDFVNNWDQIHSEGQNNQTGRVNGLGAGQILERENLMGSIDKSPLKWPRSGSLTSRGSGFSHSSSSKSMGVDPGDAKAKLEPRNGTPVQSPSGDAVACATSAALSEETNSRKKPRLGWGEGLAKYEKKKVDGPDDSATKNGMVVCVNTEPLHSNGSILSDKSPRFTAFSDCASPGTPSSVACSTSTGMEDKPPVKRENIDNDTSKLSGSPRLLSQNHVKGIDFNLENSDLIPIANLCSSLGELLQSDNPVDSSFERSTAMNKLLVWKGDVLKTLEMTESEIDLLENELKLLTSESRSSCHCLAGSSSLQRECQAKPCEELLVNSSGSLRPAPLQLVSSGDMIAKEAIGGLEEARGQLKDEDIDSPGTVSSKFVEPHCSVNAAAMSESVKHGGSKLDLDASKPSNQEVTCSVYGSNGKKEESLSDCDSGGQLMASKSCAAPVGASLHSSREDKLYDLILTSNKDSARKASDVFNKLLPSDRCHVDILRASSVSRSQNDPLIQEKFATRKRFVRFKQRVITLKFWAFQHLWKEDMRLLSIRKHHAKSQKRLELSSRTTHYYQKYRSSICSRFSSPARNLSLVPTPEISKFITSKLLSDSQVKLYRNSLKMPAMILDKKEKMISRFITSNGLVEDPYAIEKERVTINRWTTEEREIFMDKLSIFGKDFRMVASFLDHKTTGDCIEFYYRNHKSDWFVKIKKPELAGQGKLCSTNNYLVTSGKRWNREMNASSLDMLGAAIAANGDDGRQSLQKCKSRFLMGETTVYRAPRGDDGIVQRSGNLDRFSNESERETVAADVLAGICGSIPSEAMSSCIKSSYKPGESCKDWKCQKVGSSTRWPLTTVVAQNVVDGTCSDKSCGEMDPTHWTDEEKSIFIQAVSSYGKDFTMISRCVRTRSRDECIVFFSKARKCLGLDMIRPRPGDEEVHANDNVNGSGGDNEDACVVETGSVICREISGSKIDEETMLSDLNKDHCESDPTETMNVQTDRNSLDENNGTGGIGCKDPELQSENMVADDRQSDGKLELHFDGDFKMDNGIDTMTVIVQGHKDAVFPPATETGGDEATVEGTSFGEPLSAKEADGQGLSGSGADGDIIAVGQKLGVQQPASENNLNEKQEENGYTSTSDYSDLYSVENLHANMKSSNLAEDINTCMEFGGDHKQEPKISLELNPPPESDVISVEHNVPLVNANSLTKDPPASQHELILSPDKPCTLGLEKMSDNQCKKSARSDDHNLHQSGDTVLGHTNSSQILRGYPLRLSTKKEVNRDISSKKLGSFQSFSNGCFLRKCKNSQTQSLAAELPFLSPEHKTDHSQPPPEKSYRNGDLKLFGKILTYPTSQQNEDIGVIHENKDEGVQHPKLSSKTFNLKFKGTVSVDGNSIPPKLDHINYLGLESLPVRSYGYWDGTRTRTGYSSLPDSAILLAKYPAAFSNCSSLSDSEQQQSHSVVRSNERNLNGVSGFSSRERSISNGVADSQLYRNREGVSVQPLTVDMKQRQEMLFSEMQRRNGLEAVSNVPQAAKGVVGINMGGRGGILGGACTGVSDSVAVIKMHYAKAEQYGVQTTSVIREEESWRGKGDLGR
ncbi:Nuclear receptor corepressor 1 like [Actinidia chinensis var. chinensis]|uniref:Nuclear receptor corepressor 1 like n=1 Tax=Actinidia chinensis var. chinensis TaxID=1590841 RepID=A0A2R6RTR7_ACTCC|nr:Nuclear receptor corepressor 1 like [Actinidia chinensis var. chinensis]